MTKPNDTQCKALIDSEGEEVRCENPISYDSEGDNWSIFCVDHRQDDDDARDSGEPRVRRVGDVPVVVATEPDPVDDTDGMGE